MMTQYEKEHAAQLMALVHDNMIAATKVRAIANENGMERLADGCDDLIKVLEKRYKECFIEVMGGE